MSEYYTGSGRIPPDLMGPTGEGQRGEERRERKPSPERRARDDDRDSRGGGGGREGYVSSSGRREDDRSREDHSRDDYSRQRDRARPREGSSRDERDRRPGFGGGGGYERDRDRDSRKRYRDLDDDDAGRDRIGGRRQEDSYRDREGGRDNRERRDDYREARQRTPPPREERRPRREDPIPAGEPCQTMVVRGLHRSITEEDIGIELAKYASVSQIRLTRDRDTGEHKGVAFIDYSSMEGAMNVNERLRGYIHVKGQEARIEYSTDARPGAGGGRSNPKGGGMDWICPSCKTVNWAKRTSCFKCAIERTENCVEVPSGTPDTAASSDTDMVLITGLGPHSTDDSVMQAIAPFTPPGGWKIVRVIRDPSTNQSRGMCFVCGYTVRESSDLIQAARGMAIDGAEVSMAFAKPREIAQAMSGGGGAVLKGGSRIGQMAIDQAMSQIRPVPPNVPAGFVWDERSGWYYHSTTGYYFDAATNLYYEPMQKKYYEFDHSSGSYVEKIPESSQATWEAEEEVKEAEQSEAQQSAAQAAAQAAAAMAEFGKKKKKEKANAVKPSTGAQGTSMTAIRIGGLGAEIAKWKGQQGNLVAAREAVENERPSERVSEGIAIAKGAHVLVPDSQVRLAGRTTSNDSADNSSGGWDNQAGSNQSNASSASATTTSAPAASAGSGTVCLLCRRKFASAEQLAKHEQQSEMHKQKVEEARKAEIAKIKQDVIQDKRSQEKKIDKTLRQHDYAQRAREEEEKARVLKEAEEAALSGKEVSKNGPSMDNKGTEMLMKMGWTSGQGLGASSQGTTTHVGVVQREERAGIGCGGVTTEEDMMAPGDSYRTMLYKKASSRMQNVEDEDMTAWRQNYAQGQEPQ